MWLRSVKDVFETAVNPRTFHVVAANAFACLAEEHLNTVHQLACKAVFNNGDLALIYIFVAVHVFAISQDKVNSVCNVTRTADTVGVKSCAAS